MGLTLISYLKRDPGKSKVETYRGNPKLNPFLIVQTLDRIIKL